MSQNAGLMQGKRGVILGVANNRSIAWGIGNRADLAGRRAEETGRTAG
jgi:enoyl-[acyl-carrier protein] reductase I